MTRINVKLGGINVIPDPRDASFLSDSANPTMVMGRFPLSQRSDDCAHTLGQLGADITHPPPGNRGRPHYTSLVGSIDPNAVLYAHRMSVQWSPQEVIEDLENMCVVGTLSTPPSLRRRMMTRNKPAAPIRAVQRDE